MIDLEVALAQSSGFYPVTQNCQLIKGTPRSLLKNNTMIITDTPLFEITT
jgi:hypothetical protein